MKRTPAVSWSEGMFMRPHHFQSAERARDESLQAEIRRIQPFAWGLSRFDVAPDQLENYIFEVRDVDARLADGASLVLGSTMRLSARPFKAEMDASGGRMQVWLGVPALRESSPNAFAPSEGPGGQDRGYIVENVEVRDENTGLNPQRIAVRRLNGRLFFGGDSREGYECVPVAVVERSAQGRNLPALARDFVPPVTEMSASRTLQVMVESVTNRIEAKHRLLLTDLAQGRITTQADGASAWQTIIKLQILGSFLFLFQQLSRIPRVHPFSVYLELCRLAGELSVFEDGKKLVQVPLYDHDSLGKCFAETCRVIEALLEKIVASKFIKIDFVLREELLVAELEPAWLAPETEFYLAIETSMEEKDLRNRMVTMKLGTVKDIPVLVRRRLFGLDLEMLKRTPSGLPAREDYFYFKIEKDGEYWENVVRERIIALSDAIDAKLKFSLYIITKPGS